jgi:hypothetical protein
LIGERGDDEGNWSADDVNQALAEWGDTPPAQQEKTQSDVVIVQVEPENEAAVRLFLQLKDTQWDTQVVVAGKHLLTFRNGLKYDVLPALAAGLDPPVALSESVMAGLRQLEREALAVFRRRLERQIRS